MNVALKLFLSFFQIPRPPFIAGIRPRNLQLLDSRHAPSKAWQPALGRGGRHNLPALALGPQRVVQELPAQYGQARDPTMVANSDHQDLVRIQVFQLWPSAERIPTGGNISGQTQFVNGEKSFGVD